MTIIKSKYKRIGKEGKPYHRMVVEKAIGRKLSHDEVVHHINGNTFDNRIENLQIVTPCEHARIHNQKYPRRKICVVCGKEYEPYESKRKTGKVCSISCKVELAKRNAAKRKRPILQLNMDGEVVRSWDSARDAQEETGFFESNINKCCNGKIPSYKGFVWKYKDCHIRDQEGVR